MSDNKLEKLTFITLYDRSLSVCALSKQVEGGLPVTAESKLGRYAARFVIIQPALLEPVPLAGVGASPLPLGGVGGGQTPKAEALL